MVAEELTIADLKKAHKHSFRNKAELQVSKICGCFYCEKTCSFSEVTEWTDEGDPLGETGLCPHCGIDSLIGSASGLPITSAFLKQMNEHFF